MKIKDIRYSSIIIITLLILNVVFVNIFSVFMPTFENIFQNDFKNFIFNENLYWYIRDSKFNEGIINYNIGEDRTQYFTYYSIRREVDNFVETQDFKTLYPNNVIYKIPNSDLYYADRKFQEEYILRHETSQLDDYQETKKNYNDITKNYIKITDENFAKPNLILKKTTNDFAIKLENFDSINSIISKIDLPYIHVKKNDITNKEYESELKFEVKNSEKLSAFQNKIVDYLKKSFEEKEINEHIFYDAEIYENTEFTKLNYIKDYEAIFVINPVVQRLENIINERVNLDKIVFNCIIFSVIMLFLYIIITSITQYQKSKKVRFYQILEIIPVEIWFLLIFIPYLFIHFGNMYVYEKIYKEIKIDSKIIISFSYSMLLISMIIVIYYIIHSLKSFYNEGTKSYVVRNSIIYRVIMWMFSFLSRIVSIIYRTIIGVNIKNKSIRLLIFIILSLLGYILSGFDLVFIFLWVLVLLFIYYIINKLLGDVKNIEDATYEINKGNFNVNLNEDNTYFGNISRNLNNINETLTKAMEKELKSERMKTELISNVSHDLKTPLTAIINYSDLASKENASQEDIKRYVQIINEKSIKLKSLIENLFEVAKVTSNNIRLNKVKIDLNLMIDQMVGEWDQEFSVRNLDVVFNSNKESTIVELDGEQTSRIFDNLFSNINKYALENTRVYIDLKQDERTTLIIKNVSKYGLNISPDELKERFTRGDESRNTEGSGLGLAIASSLTELQGGTFDIEIDGDLFKIVIVF